MSNLVHVHLVLQVTFDVELLIIFFQLRIKKKNSWGMFFPSCGCCFPGPGCSERHCSLPRFECRLRLIVRIRGQD